MQEYEINGNRNTVYVLSIVSLFIIVMAWVNYVNLSTARSLKRAREVGLRKVVGSTRGQLMIQFLFETTAINIIAMLLALIIVLSALPVFHEVTNIPINYSFWLQDWVWPTIIILFLAGVFLSGFYPVAVLSSFKPIAVLRGKLANSAQGINLRKFLVIFQFVLALLLLTGTFSVFRQISFMRNQELGFDMNQILVFKSPRVRDEFFHRKFQSFKESLLGNPNVNKIYHVTEVPGRQIYYDAEAIQKAGEDISKGKNYQIMGIDYDFVDLFDIKLIQGRNFSKEFPTDKAALILNETAVKWMEFEDAKSALGQKVDYWGDIFTIVGVIKDYHQQSPKQSFEPTIFRFLPHGRDIRGVFAVKVNNYNVRETVQLVNKRYNEMFPGNPFDYFFLDEYYDQQFKSDILFGRVFGLFSILAIFVTALGIFGLSSFSAEQRTKEIGIRKILIKFSYLKSRQEWCVFLHVMKLGGHNKTYLNLFFKFHAFLIFLIWHTQL